MKIIKNPTQEQIDAALAIVEESTMIKAHRYAMTKDGTAILDGMLHRGINTVKAIRHITVYNDYVATVAYVLEDIGMYPKETIIAAGYNPLPQEDIPAIFKDLETILYYD